MPLEDIVGITVGALIVCGLLCAMGWTAFEFYHGRTPRQREGRCRITCLETGHTYTDIDEARCFCTRYDGVVVEVTPQELSEKPLIER